MVIGSKFVGQVISSQCRYQALGGGHNITGYLYELERKVADIKIRVPQKVFFREANKHHSAQKHSFRIVPKLMLLGCGRDGGADNGRGLSSKS